VIGIALLGAGRMARVHAKAIGAAGGRLVTVYDVVEPAAKSLAADTGASVARSVEEALHHPEVDAVLVVTSSDTHVECILQGIQAGKAVMCEKPLAPTLSEAQHCINALGAKASKVFLAFNRRFDAGHAALKRAIELGEIGNLEQLTITSRDTACVVLMTSSGKQAVILNSRRAAYGYDQRIEAFGSAGMVISDNPRAAGIRRYSSTSFGAPDRLFTFYMDRYGDSYRKEIETFLGGVATGTPPPVNAIDGLRTAYPAEAAGASLRLGQAVELKTNCEVSWHE
jgi:myo-inositol 2-dehydrogenase/D-chiro-inositol 1-dehydrogenase